MAKQPTTHNPRASFAIARAGRNATMTTNANATASYFKTVQTLHGSVLFTYTAAILATLGLLGKPNQPCPTFSKQTLCRFYGSDAVIRHHTAKGNIERINGSYRITAQGKDKFMGRVVGSNGQSVDRDLLPEFMTAIKTGGHNPRLGKMYPVK
jgi:hypothetical protein